MAHPQPVLPRLVLALACSALVGVLVAGLAFPLVGGIGLTAKAQADDFLARPADLQIGTLDNSSRILAADGSVLAVFFSENRLNASLDEVPELARKALIAIEDSRFYVHNGVDFKGTLRAAVRNGTSGGVRQGGSTLTQQLVKNLLLEQARNNPKAQKAARVQNLDRKLTEARYALALEKKMTKDQILEAYLNIAYYGNGVYGIKTAANHYFGKPVQKLTLAEGALLAGMVQNPNRLDPSNKATRGLALARRAVVLDRMSDLGLITASQAAAARQEPLHLSIRLVRSGCEAPGVEAPFFCDFVRREVEADTPLGRLLGDTREERQQRLLGGGLTIRTTFDSKVQKAAQTAVDTQVPPKDPFGAAAVADSVEPSTGDVKAMAVNRTFGESKDRPEQTKVNLAVGGTLGFQGGSTFKLFVLARALQMGIPLSTKISSPARYTSKVFSDNGQPYAPSNAGESEAGVFDLVSGTAESVNTFFVQLEERTGTDKPAALAEDLGVHNLANKTGDLNRGGSFTLGGDTVSPLAMAGAYAAFANHGNFCPPRAVTAITDYAGKPLAVPAQRCTQVIEPDVADTVTSVLQGVIDGPIGNRTGAKASIGRPAAGKTGTADDSRATWFIGYVPQLCTAVWVGKTTPTPLQNVRINGTYYKSVYGGSIAAPLWGQAMQAALQGVPTEQLANPNGNVGQGQLITVPDVTGQPYDAARQVLIDAGFSVLRGRTVDGAPIPSGGAARTSPAAGSAVPSGSTVYLYPSNGQPPRTPTTSPPPAPASPGPTPVPTKTRKPGPPIKSLAPALAAP